MSIVSTVAPSFWLDQLGPEPLRTALDGRQEADVCVVGGGFTGLWTAYELARAEPGLKVLVLEAEQVGFGASGRNGGWVLGVVSGSPSAWQRRGGPDAPRRMSRAIQDTVAEIGATVTREQINCDWHHGGSLTVAQNETQMERIKAELQHELAWAGEDCARQLLDATQLAQRVAVDHGLGAAYTQACARIQPAALVRGLARAIEAAGATIHEASRVTRIAPHRVLTAGVEVRSRHILLATEGYTANLPERHRALLPLNSSMIVTEPLDAGLWRQGGFRSAPLGARAVALPGGSRDLCAVSRG